MYTFQVVDGGLELWQKMVVFITYLIVTIVFLKLEPNNGDKLSLVGDQIEEGFSEVVVVGGDEYIYSISDEQIILKFSPKDSSLSYLGRRIDDNHNFHGAVLASDGDIYTANRHGQILKVSTANNDCTIIGNEIYNNGNNYGWGHPVLGADKCIYFPPPCHDRVLKFNPKSQSISLIGESFGDGEGKWSGSILASDGFIYCVPCSADDILQIDSRHTNDQILTMMESL